MSQLPNNNNVQPIPHPNPAAGKVRDGSKCPRCNGLSLDGSLCQNCKNKISPPGQNNGPLVVAR